MKALRLTAKLTFAFFATLFLLGTAAFFIFKLPQGPSAERFAGVEIAHRGGYEWGPENTLSTLEIAVQQGVKAVEVDIAYTADSVLLLYHDERVDLLTIDTGLIYAKTWEEVSHLHVKDANGNLSQNPVCSLEEFLTWLPEDLLVEFDLKHWLPDQNRAAAALAQAIKKHGLQERSFISSFDPRTLYSLRSEHPDLITGYAVAPESGMGAIADGLLDSPLLIDFLGVSLLEPHYSEISEGYAQYWKDRGLVLNAWTLNGKAQKAELLSWGVSVTTNCPFGDCPDRAQDLWPPQTDVPVVTAPSTGEGAEGGVRL